MIVAFVLVALNASSSGASPTMTVVVAAADLQPRVAIRAQDLATASISVPDSYPKIYFSTVGEVVGMIPLVGVSKSQAITANDVAKPNEALGSQSEYLPIPSGYVALTLPTSEEQGVAYNIQPNDYISVIATVTTGGKVADKTIFTNMHVIKVGVSGTTGAPSSLTVVVTECQAEILTWFLNYASLKYTLQSFHDYRPADQAPDPACPSIEAAKGVTLQIIQSAYPTLF